ncbi:MAG: DUF1015 family protein [Nitrospiraceae bacterium]|nr:DUF1015 family protein [Nitrospiraceae bacterium]
MLDVRGFRGFRFSKERAGALDAVITPPYDVLSPRDRALLAERSPYSVVRLILPEAEGERTPYETAAHYLESWIGEGVLTQDAEDSMYLIEQSFRDASGKERVRRGFFAVARLPEAGENLVLGHERTFGGVLDDRLQLFEACAANVGPVFVLYDDPESDVVPFLRHMDECPPDMIVTTLDGTTQRVWRVAHDKRVSAFMRNKRLYIADGHHRFRTACTYRDRMRAKDNPTGPMPYDYVLLGFVSMSDPGLIIGPTHRLMAAPDGFDAAAFLETLEPWFEVKAADTTLAEDVADGPGCTIGVAMHGQGRSLLTLRDVDRAELLGNDRGPAWCGLDVAILHGGIVGNLMGLGEGTSFTYEKDAAAALAAVDRGDFGLGFLLKPTTAEQMRACAEAGEAMPHKSTYFFPKLPTGAVIYRLV